MSQVHAGSVTAISALSDFSPTGSADDVADLVLTAGSDCLVNVWLWDGLGASLLRCAEAETLTKSSCRSGLLQVLRRRSRVSKPRARSRSPSRSLASLARTVCPAQKAQTSQFLTADLLVFALVPILALSSTDRKVQIWPYESESQQVWALPQVASRSSQR